MIQHTNTRPNTHTNFIPKDITKDKDNGLEIASFSYYAGIQYAKHHKLQQTTDFEQIISRTHYIVCCGDVMVRVKSSQYTGVPRRKL